jgi:hypothetical protein
VGVHHYPRIAGEATGGSPRVIVRAVGETLALWWRMRTYRPSENVRRPGPVIRRAARGADGHGR